MFYILNVRDKLESLDIKYFRSQKSFPSRLWSGGGWSDIPGKEIIFVKDRPSPN